MSDVRGRLVSLVIEVSRFDEDATNAIETAVVCKSYIKDVHIVRVGGAPKTDTHWCNLLKQLSDADLDYVCIHASGKLDPKKLSCSALVRMPADMVATVDAMAQLVDDMITHAESCDHYAISSTTYVGRMIPLEAEGDEEQRMPMTMSAVWGATSYGFLLVVLVLDTLRSIASAFQYHRTCDLRGQFVYRSYPNRAELAPNRWLRWWIFTGVCPARRMDKTCAQSPSPADQGWTFALRSVRLHSGMGLGLWFFGFALYYYLFSAPWWVWLFQRGAVAAKEVSWSWWMLVSPKTFLSYLVSARDLGAVHWMSLHALHFSFVGYLTSMHMGTPFGGLLVLQTLLYTVYLAFSPLFFLVARWMPIRSIRVKQ